jgi:uncharacterized protein YjlB
MEADRLGPHDERRRSSVSSLFRTHDDPTAGVQALWFAADGWIPNNAELPVLHYRQAMREPAGDSASAFEALLRRNSWSPQWRNGIYPFHHYHSTAHEVLGIAAGNARVQLGGPNGTVVGVTAGDCLLLPAGTGHCLIDASTGFLVVGAYPPGQDWDLRRSALSRAEHAAMSTLAVPTTDPVTGTTGALLAYWSEPT